MLHEECLPNHLLFGSTLATVPEASVLWYGAALTILPLVSLKYYRGIVLT